jgi:formylglycine-generating enzyme
MLTTARSFRLKRPLVLAWLFVVHLRNCRSRTDLHEDIGTNLDPHPDPNNEDYQGMIYVGRHHHHNGRRVSLEEADWRIKFIFGTSFDENHKEIEEEDLHHGHYGADVQHDVPDLSHGRSKSRRHGEFSDTPKPFGHVETHPLDGGVTPAKVVELEPFFLDATPVTNAEFARFVAATYYETEAELYNWSFVLKSFVSPKLMEEEEIEVDPEAPDWVSVPGAYWRHPEGKGSSWKFREQHPVVHVSHKDAAEYCSWVGKRLPGEFEYEAAARSAPHYTGPRNRTLYLWGEDQTVAVAQRHANLWGEGTFPDVNLAEDGWRGTSPVRHFPPNHLGFYDMTGNVWEWMRGGISTGRIVRGASYVDSLDGSFNHAATLGARATLHGTTTTGNVGFRCAKSPRKRVEYHWTWHDEDQHGKLAVEDEFGRRDMVPQRGWEDLFNVHLEEDGMGPKRKRVVKRVERLSDEL